jgi:hypothetical protein
VDNINYKRIMDEFINMCTVNGDDFYFTPDYVDTTPKFIIGQKLLDKILNMKRLRQAFFPKEIPPYDEYDYDEYDYDEYDYDELIFQNDDNNRRIEINIDTNENKGCIYYIDEKKAHWENIDKFPCDMQKMVEWLSECN